MRNQMPDVTAAGAVVEPSEFAMREPSVAPRAGTQAPRASGMTPAQRARWAQIAAFEIGDPSWTLPFEARLARENAWDRAFAARVVAEYKRFVFLMVEAGHPVTPSDEVDQAWHLHMVYTRSYWDQMCTGLLGRPLHHGPTKGGRAEDARFVDWYGRTLASYQRLFGETPPADIWPNAQTRFTRAPAFARINTSENWIISKSRVRQGTLAAGTLLAVAGALAGCGVAMNQLGTTTFSRELLIFAGLAALALILWIVSLIRRGQRQNTLAPRTRRPHGTTNTTNTTSGCSSFTHGAMMGTMMHHDPARHGSGGEVPAHTHSHNHSHAHSHGHSHDHTHHHSHSHDATSPHAPDSASSDTGGSDSGSGGAGSDSGSSGCGSSGCGGGGCGGGGD